MLLNFYSYNDFPKEKQASFEDVLGGSYNELKISEVLPDYTYAVFRAVTADVPNMNSDQFDTEELDRFDERLEKHVYSTFNGRSIFTNHQSDKVENSIGVIFDSHFDKTAEDDRFVEIVFGVDKKKAGDIARGIETGRLRNGSMGCSITHSLCTVCGKSVQKESDFCNHLKNHRGSYYQGKKVAERLRGVNFQEYSIVTVGADPKAECRYILASVIGEKRLPKVASTSDIFGLMSLVAKEVKSASVNDKISIIKNLDNALSHIEGITFKPFSFQPSDDINETLNKKLGLLFSYTRDSYFVDNPGKVERAAETDNLSLQNLIGKEVEVDSNNNIYIV